MEIDMTTLALKPSDMTQALRYLISTRQPGLMVGPPGCGKSDIGAQAAEAEGMDILVIHPVLGDPTDGKGVPWCSAEAGRAILLPLDEAYQIINATEPLAVLLDDVGQAMPAVQASWMQPILARRMAGQAIPDCVTFLAMTNRRGDKAGVSGILEPVKGRFTILHMLSDLNDFVNNLYDRGASYGLSDDTIAMAVAFMRFKKDPPNQFEPTADMTNSPTERNWVSAFRHTQAGLPSHIEHALVAGRIGAGKAVELMGFIRMRRSMPPLEAILLNPDKAEIPKEPSTLWAVSMGLAGMATTQNFGRIGKYAERMEQELAGEFATLLIRDACRRSPNLAMTDTFNRLMTGSLGKLVTGEA
jgi:hypothetical protein